MSPDQIVRAWKRASHGECLDTGLAMPTHPIQPIEIADHELDLAGASATQTTEYLETLGCCQGFTQYGMCDVTAGMPGFCTTFCITIVFTTPSICKR